MNPTPTKEGRGDGDEATAGKSSPPASSCDITETDEMKRAAAKQLIERYYHQLTDGCGISGCKNEFCASSPKFHYPDISRNTAALRAIELVKSKALLCDPSKPSKVAKNGSTRSVSHEHHAQDIQGKVDSSSGSLLEEQPSTSSLSKNSNCQQIDGSSNAGTKGAAKIQSSSPTKQSTEKDLIKEEIPYLTEEIITQIITECEKAQTWSKLNRLIGSVYNNSDSLLRSFKLGVEEVTGGGTSSVAIDVGMDKCQTQSDGSVLSEKKHVEINEQDCSFKKYKLTVDLESLRRAYTKLFSIPNLPFQAALINALIYLSRELEMDLKYHHIVEKNGNYLNVFIAIMEIPVLHTPEFIDSATPHLCRVLGQLPIVAQAGLAHIWATFSHVRLKEMVENLQQLITVKVISTNWNRQHFVNDDEVITGAVRVMKMLFYASVLGGDMDDGELVEAEKVQNQAAEDNLHELFQGAVGHEPKEKLETKPDPLAKELNIQAIDCRKPLVAWEDFINEPLCEQIQMEHEYRDYQHYKIENDNKFSFLAHPFMLTTGIKNQGMNFDNRIRMLNERRQSIFQSIVHGAPTTPYLRLKIRRDHIIDDALVSLELVAMDNPQDLKKQLYVEFEGEQGIDEGGVSKEFFQLVVEEIFNPDIGMFTLDEETQKFWFNPTSFENDGQFTLIGIVLGLAIYNNVILDVHFPMVVYRKLMGKLGTFEDLKDSHPILAKGLQELLNFDGCVEEVMQQTFRISYKDIFDSVLTHDLKENGDSLLVNNKNRKEFVNMYADFLLNQSIERQFKAFHRGFHMVIDESPLKMFFRPEEVELLVCGSKKFDFHALEEAAEYDGGFSSESSTIRNFWELVHSMTEEQKRKLLQFTTGSDRVPVGGLAKLKLIIARNGPDTDRLPTSHTCFNVLLLPDYSTREKLLERLLKAISYAKGFGML